jgi:hypothetical protein
MASTTNTRPAIDAILVRVFTMRDPSVNPTLWGTAFFNPVPYGSGKRASS